MTNFLFVLIVFFLFYDCSKAFDHWTVAETWPAGFCSAIPCNAGKAKLRKFTIHGLWPSNYTNPQPRTCSSQVLQISEVRFPFKFMLLERWYIGKNIIRLLFILLLDRSNRKWAETRLARLFWKWLEVLVSSMDRSWVLL